MTIRRLPSVLVAFLCAATLLLAPRRAWATETLSFQSGGQTIRADFYPPATGKTHRGAIIVLHGAGGMLFDGPEMRRVAERLARDGDAVYLMHYFNRTGSLFFARDAGMLKNFDLWLATVREGVDWVARQETARGNAAPSIGIYGYSLGAFLALATASDNKQVAAVVEQSGGIWNNQERRIGRLPPVLVIHGRADPRVPFRKYAVPMVELMKRRGDSFQTRFYDSEAHSFSPVAQREVREQISDFFRRHLR